MKTKGQHTLTEIITQPAAWADAIRAFRTMQETLKQDWASLNPRYVLFTGCGSTYYLSQAAASVFQGLVGVPARACPASEIVLFTSHALSDPKHTLLVAISRSGTTTETLDAVATFRRLGGPAIWAITCYPQNPLARQADRVLLAEAAQEHGVAQTRSFSSMLILAEALAATIAGEDMSLLETVPDLGQRLLDQTAPISEALGRRTDLVRFFFLGSGPQYGVANEAMLKMKEMSLSYSEAFHFMEFRHGPTSMVNEQTLVMGLLSQAARVHEQRVLNDVSALGAQTLSLVASPGANTLQLINLPGSLPAWALPVLYLPPLQLMAYHHAISKDLDPDNPCHLEAVVLLDRALFENS